jgi:hypothetical protein
MYTYMYTCMYTYNINKLVQYTRYSSVCVMSAQMTAHMLYQNLTE